MAKETAINLWEIFKKIRLELNYFYDSEKQIVQNLYEAC